MGDLGFYLRRYKGSSLDTATSQAKGAPPSSPAHLSLAALRTHMPTAGGTQSLGVGRDQATTAAALATVFGSWAQAVP